MSNLYVNNLHPATGSTTGSITAHTTISISGSLEVSGSTVFSTLGVSSYITASSGIRIPADKYITFGTGSTNRMDVATGTGITISGSGVRVDSSANISLDASGGSVVFQKDNVDLLSIASGSTGPQLGAQIAGADLRFLTAGANVAAKVDSTNDGFGMYRKVILGGDGTALTISGSAVPTTTPTSIIHCTASVDNICTLADSSLHGQLKVVLGLKSSSGDPKLIFNNPAGSVTKTFTNATGIILYSVQTGESTYKWIPLGDTS